MAQIDSGLRKILELPWVYSSFQRLIGAVRTRRLLLDKFICLKDGMRVLDVGCGPADILSEINQKIYYLGLDFEESYIDKARARYGDRGTFICQDVGQFKLTKPEDKFDRILLFAILHHLDDQEVNNLLGHLAGLLKPDGRLVSVENVYTDDQSFLARKIIAMDRGQNVRNADGYLNLLKGHFKKVNFEIRHDLLRMPYTHILMTAEL